MRSRVIQASFPGGRAPAAQAAAIQPARSAVPRPGAAPVGQRAAVGMVPPFRPGPPAPAFRPPAGAAPVQAHGVANSFAVDPNHLGLNRGGGMPLPQVLLAKMQAAFGADFSTVRIHQGPQAARIGALAFTIGSDIYFAPGRYQPESMQGQQLLGHELTHVLQQRQGRVRAPAGTAMAVVQDAALEAEADRRGRQAAACCAASMVREGAGMSLQQKPRFLVVQRMLSSSNGGSGDDEDWEPWKKYEAKNAQKKLEKQFAKKKVVSEEDDDGDEEEVPETPEKISKSLLNREYPYGGKKVTPHIHQYPSGFHLKIAGGRRINLFQGGVEYASGVAEALEYANSVIASRPNLKKILEALLKKYRK